MKNFKRAACGTMAAAMAACTFAACGSSGSSASANNTFSWWISTAENSEFYTDYDENPIIKYIEAYKTFEDKDGNQASIGFDFQSGVRGSEQDNFNNMIATGTYTDVFDPVYYAGSVVDLYKEGTILDMTDYVNQYMPNYKKWMEEHPDAARYMTQEVDGEQKFLSIYSTFEDISMYDQWYGYAYRRDWLVKYGTQPDTFYDPMTDSEPKTNPNAGQAFSGHYTLDTDGNANDITEYTDNVNGDSWVDDVVFPSGNVDPVYITDWEWMLDIFAKALDAEGITDGYGLSLYYPGFVGTGDLVSGFGGIGPTWYLDENGKCTFGGTSEGFKAYLECMSTWYKNGWIDQRFDQRSSDAFYQIDNTTVRQGKVGAWLATPSELMSRIQTDTLETTKGAVVYTCASPINDKYGSEEAQLKKPTCFSSPELISSSIVVTDKAKDKELKMLCEFLDYLYSEDGLLLANGGLNQEQAAEAQDATYAAYGVDYGYDPVQGDDGKTLMDLTPKLYADEGDIRSAMTLGRLWRLSARNRYVSKDTETYTHQRENWVKYEATGAIGAIVNGQLDSDQAATMQKLTNRIGAEYMYIEVPKFIKGTYNLTSDWDNFVSDLNKRDYQSLVDTYNEALNK